VEEHCPHKRAQSHRSVIEDLHHRALLSECFSVEASTILYRPLTFKQRAQHSERKYPYSTLCLSDARMTERFSDRYDRSLFGASRVHTGEDQPVSARRLVVCCAGKDAPVLIEATLVIVVQRACHAGGLPNGPLRVSTCGIAQHLMAAGRASGYLHWMICYRRLRKARIILRDAKEPRYVFVSSHGHCKLQRHT